MLEGRVSLRLLLHLLLFQLLLLLELVGELFALLYHASVIWSDYAAPADDHADFLDQFGLGALMLHERLVLCNRAFQRIWRRDVESWWSILVDLPGTVLEVRVFVEVLGVGQVVNVDQRFLQFKQLVEGRERLPELRVKTCL